MDRQLKKRIKDLQRALVKERLNAYLVQSPVDLYYLTGLQLSCGDLYIPACGRPQLFVDDRYLERARSVMPAMRSETRALFHWLSELIKSQGLDLCNFGFDSAAMSVESFEKLRVDLAKDKKMNACLKWSPYPQLVAQQRSFKDGDEIELLKKAAELGAEGFDFAISQLVEGITEKEVARSLEIYWLQKGAEGPSFRPNISFGANTSSPHHVSGAKSLKTGDLVLIDIGVCLNHYCSDFTRSFFFGELENAPQAKLQRIWNVVTKALARALQICRAGVSIDQLDAAARDVIESAGFGDRFTHGLGHGVGLQVHELPTLRRHPQLGQSVLRTNQVITIEPGIYLEGLGGVRQEEMVLVQENGPRLLVERPFHLTAKEFVQSIANSKS